MTLGLSSVVVKSPAPAGALAKRAVVSKSSPVERLTPPET